MTRTREEQQSGRNRRQNGEWSARLDPVMGGPREAKLPEQRGNCYQQEPPPEEPYHTTGLGTSTSIHARRRHCRQAPRTLFSTAHTLTRGFGVRAVGPKPNPAVVRVLLVCLSLHGGQSGQENRARIQCRANEQYRQGKYRRKRVRAAMEARTHHDLIKKIRAAVTVSDACRLPGRTVQTGTHAQDYREPCICSLLSPLSTLRVRCLFRQAAHWQGGYPLRHSRGATQTALHDLHPYPTLYFDAG